MDANVLRERLAAAIQEFIDPEAWERHRLVETAEIETIRTVASRMM